MIIILSFVSLSEMILLEPNSDSKHELIGRDFINIFNFNNDHPKML